MPRCPVGLVNSPYADSSAFAGNLRLVALEPLVERGWVRAALPDQAPRGPAEMVDYPPASAYKGAALRNLSARFETHADGASRDAFEAFRQEQRAWLDDFA